MAARKFVPRLSAAVAVLLAAAISAAPAPAVPVLDRDVFGSAGDGSSGGPFTLGMTVGETIVGFAFPVAGTRAEIAGFWGTGDLPVLDVPRPNALAQSHGFAIEISPNPFVAEAVVRCTVPGAAIGMEVRAAIYDTRGRRVRSLDAGAGADGGYALVWDGRDDQGRSVVAGIYFCRVNAGPYTTTRRIARIR